MDANAANTCEACGPDAAGGCNYSGRPGIIAAVKKGTFAGVQRCDLCERYKSDEAAEAALIAAGLKKVQPSKLGQILDINIQSIQQHDPDEDTLLGVCEIAGVPHHAQFVRVHDVERSNGRIVQLPTSDPYDRYMDTQRFYRCSKGYVTIEAPGFEGHYVLVIHPFEV